MLITSMAALADFPRPRSGNTARLFHPPGRGQRRRRSRRSTAASARATRPAMSRRTAPSRLPGSVSLPIGLVSCHQVHGTTAITVEGAWRREENPRADAMVTATPGIALGVLAADCAPVLFADPEARIIGAAHGGWRGALAGIMEATVAAMTRLGARPERIRAGIGPCIAQPSYEVGAEFHADLHRGRSGQPPLLPAGVAFRPFSVRSARLHRGPPVAARPRRGRARAA